MAIRVTLNCQIKTEQLIPLQEFLTANLPRVRAFDGCRRVSVLMDKNKQEMLLDEEWSTIEKHQGYIRFISDKGIMQALVSFLEGEPQVRYFELQDI